ncbi:MAG: T9SS type A sorting domain-containing protein [bacterium]|nr:T9SS type A sorting domain-containing protein [bacterium]
MPKSFSFCCLFLLVVLGLIALAPAARDNHISPAEANMESLQEDVTTYLDANNLLVFLTNTGRFATDQSSVFGRRDGFYFPFTGDTQDIVDGTCNQTMIWTAGLWLSGKVDNNVRTALAAFGTPEFVPGPMSGGLPLPDDPAFRVYKIDSSSSTGDADYDEWPIAHGAPVDSSGAPELVGDQTLWAVYNDAGVHTSGFGGSTDPLGIEVHQKAWAGDESGLGNVTFVQYKLYNHSANTIDSFYFGFWADMDLGGPFDDVAGSDPDRDAFYCYNGLVDDDVYGSIPPAWGCRILYGMVVPSADDVACFDGRPCPDFRNLGLASFHKLVSPFDPETPQHVFDYMKGVEARTSGLPYNDPVTGFQTTCFAPGDPIAGTGWIDTVPAEMRLLATCGPVTMLPGDSQQVVLAFGACQEVDRLQSLACTRELLNNLPTVFPGVVSVSPTVNRYAVSTTANFEIACDRPLDVASANDSTVILESQMSGRVAGTTEYDSLLRKITFAPSLPLPYGDRLTLRMTRQVCADNGFPVVDGFLCRFTTAVAGGTASFGEHRDYRIGNSRQCLLPCDVDRDGDRDIVTIDYGWNEVDSILAVVTNDGAGNLAKTAEYIVGGNPRDLVAVDLDNDSDLDFVTANTSDSSLTLLFNRGDGTLENITDIPLDGRPDAITVLDAEADGDLDLVLALFEPAGPTMILNNGDGTFAAGIRVDTSLHMANDIAAVDMNNDGMSDLIVCSGTLLRVYTAESGGSFVETQRSTSAAYSGSICVADFDANGLPDIALEQYQAGAISLRFNLGDSLGPEQVIAVGGSPADLTAGDLDGDGDIDLAVAGAPESHVTTMLNDGTGSFGAVTSYPCGNCPNTVALLDLDSDGDLDLAAGECNGWVHTFAHSGDPLPVDDGEVLLPTFELSQSYPNPFNPSTMIEGSLHTRCHVTLAVYNVLGRKVRTLIDGVERAGPFRAVWDGTDDGGRSVATGVYLYRIHAGEHVQTKKMLLLK